MAESQTGKAAKTPIAGSAPVGEGTTPVVGSTPGAEGTEANVAPPRGARLQAQARFGLALALIVVGFLLWVRSGFATPTGTIVSGVLPLALIMVSSLTYASVGLLLALRRPEVRIGALEAWVGVLMSMLALAWGYLAVADSPGTGTWPAAAYVSVATAVLVTPLLPALAIALGLLFPNDRLATPNWRTVVVLASVGAVAAGVGRLLRPGAVIFVGQYDNPFGVPALGYFPGMLQVFGYAALGISAVLTGACLLQRYRFGDETTRAQLRVFTAVTVAQALAFVLFTIPFLFSSVDDSMREAIVLVNLIVFAAGPLAIAIAIARYRLFEVDHLIGRTFVYGALTAILAGVYAASLKVLEGIFIWATGQSSDAALVFTTLILVTTFTPIKTHLEHLVARWWGEPPVAPGAVAAGAGAATVAGSAALATPVPTQASPFSDPAFVDALDERIRRVMREERHDDG